MKPLHSDAVLIFRLGSIGDTVVALPCFHAIARRFADRHRILLTNALSTARASSAEFVLAGSGLIDETLYYPTGPGAWRHSWSLLRTIRQRGIRTVVYLVERRTALQVYRDLLFFRFAGVTRVIGIPLTAHLRMPMTDPATGLLEYEAQRLARTLADEIEVDLSRAHWDARFTGEERAVADATLARLPAGRTVIAIAAGAKIPAKDWQEHRWAQLIESARARRDDLALVFIGAREERPLAERLAALGPGEHLNLCGDLTPRETAAVLRDCALLVCHDSGPMHLAAAAGTRCLALFGDYNRPRRWFPFGDGHRVIHDPRGVTHIAPNSVVAALDEMLPAPHRGEVARAIANVS
jgi:heptosyltransferase-3